MADDPTVLTLTPPRQPDRGALLRYVEDMLLELADLCASVGEGGLAASLAIATIQAGAAGERRRGAATSGAQPALDRA